MTPESYLSQYGVWIEQTGGEEYELSGANVIFGKDAGIEVTIFGDNGLPAVGAPVVVNIRPDGKGDDPQMPNGSGVCKFMFGAGSAYTPPARGPFSITLVDSAFVDDQHYVRFGAPLSASVRGMGDYLAQHTTWQLQYKKRGAVQPPPPPPTNDAPLIRNDDELRGLALSNIYPHGIDFLATAALVQWARDNVLGVPVTNEGRFTDPVGRRHAWQGFVWGIAECVEGDWVHIRQVEW